MNPFIKSNKPWIGLLGLAVVIVLLAFIFRPTPIHYQLNAAESLKLTTDQSLQVSIQDLAGKQLIDIRPADLFAARHPDMAINIPVRLLLEDESLELFDRLLKNGQQAVLYGNDELQTAAPVLLLQQLGYSNVKQLKGKISDSGEFKITEALATEVSFLDTAAMRVKTEVKKVSEIVPAKKKPEAVIPVKKAASSGGGC